MIVETQERHMGQETVVTVENVANFPVEAKHNQCSKGIIVADHAQESSVFRVKPGGFVQTHPHSRVYHGLIGIQGQADITYEDQQGSGVFALKPGGLCSVSPGARPHVQAGKIKGLGVATARRSA
jgi:quercetin dioxygenase-like cupin family protein